MTLKNCPRCGTTLIKEMIESPTSGSSNYSGSIDVFSPIETRYGYRCPKCGYLLIER